jgi:hypothetical protein
MGTRYVYWDIIWEPAAARSAGPAEEAYAHFPCDRTRSAMDKTMGRYH